MCRCCSPNCYHVSPDHHILFSVLPYSLDLWLKRTQMWCFLRRALSSTQQGQAWCTGASPCCIPHIQQCSLHRCSWVQGDSDNNWWCSLPSRPPLLPKCGHRKEADTTCPQRRHPVRSPRSHQRRCSLKLRLPLSVLQRLFLLLTPTPTSLLIWSVNKYCHLMSKVHLSVYQLMLSRATWYT